MRGASRIYEYTWNARERSTTNRNCPRWLDWTSPDGLWPSWRDPRVDVVVPQSGGGYELGPEGLAAVTIPAMILSNQVTSLTLGHGSLTWSMKTCQVSRNRWSCSRMLVI